MYPHQLERLTAALDAAGAEALVATSTANVAYVTGFRSFAHAALQTPQFGVFTRRGTALVIPAADVAAAVDEGVDVTHVRSFGEPLGVAGAAPGPLVRRVQAILGASAATPLDGLAAALEALAVRDGAIALDESRLPADEHRQVVERLRNLQVVGGASHFGAARRVKAPFEIECLIAALGVAEEALNEVVQMLKRGVTEREATLLYFGEIAKRGAAPLPSSVAMGDRAGLGAPWPGERALKPGELIRLDVGCVYRGYVGRVGRTAVLGEPTEAQEAIHGAVQLALEAAIDAARPGEPASEVHAAALRAGRESGLPTLACAQVGHGIGLEPCEPPALAAADTRPLEAGEVLSIEVAHGVVGQHGFLARDTVLVAIGGARVLNRSARGLVSLD